MTIYTPLIILSIFIINFYLYKKKVYTKNLFIISSIFLILYTIITILVYYNNTSHGFSSGILYGNILENHFCDEYKYIADSEILYNHFKNGDFNLWITKQLPIYEFVDMSNHPGFGNYNFFVIILTLLRLIGMHSPIDFILLKLLVYIPTSVYLFKLCKIYLNDKFALIAVIIFSILPGYILTNTLLMRDNIIICLVVCILYFILSKKYNYVALIALFILLLFFRAYLLPILIATLFFTYKNDKKLISLLDIFYIAIIIITIYFFTNYNFSLEESNIFFSFYQIQALQQNFAITYGTGPIMLLRLFSLTALHIFVDPLFINFLSSGMIYLIMISLGNILTMFVSFGFVISFIYLFINNIKYNNTKIVYLLKFTLYFTLLSSLLIMSKDSFIINRLALMWIPLFIIILIYPIANKK